jgi:hypothetical protein
LFGVESNCLAIEPLSRPSSAASGKHQPVGLQQGFLLPERLLPVLRDRRRRNAAEEDSGHDATFAKAAHSLPKPELPALDQPLRSRWSPASAAPAS